MAEVPNSFLKAKAFGGLRLLVNRSNKVNALAGGYKAIVIHILELGNPTQPQVFSAYLVGGALWREDPLRQACS